MGDSGTAAPECNGDSAIDRSSSSSSYSEESVGQQCHASPVGKIATNTRPPMTPPPRVPNGTADGVADSSAEPAEARMMRSPPMLQRLKANVEPPRTPSGNSSYEAFTDDDDERRLSASQRVRMGLSAYMAQGNSMVNGTEPIRRRSHEEGHSPNGVAAPMSCPPLFHASGKQHFSIPKAQHQRGGDFIVSKLLPSRNSLNSLMGYVRELQQSEASLRVQLQLERSRQRAEQELSMSHLTGGALQNSLMQQVENEREQARRRLEAQEQIIRDLRAQVARLQESQGVRYHHTARGVREEEPYACNAASAADPYLSPEQHVRGGNTTAAPYPVGACSDGANGYCEDGSEGAANDYQTNPALPPSNAGSRNQQLLLSPRATKPLWEPWSSGSNSPLTTGNAPMFTIAPSDADILPHSPQLFPLAAHSPTAVRSDHELRSVLSPSTSAGVDSERALPQETATEHVAGSPSPSVPPMLFATGEAILPDFMHASHSPTYAAGGSEQELRPVVEELPCPSPQFAATASLDAAQSQDPSANDASAAPDASTPSPPKLFRPFQPHSTGKVRFVWFRLCCLVVRAASLGSHSCRYLAAATACKSTSKPTSIPREAVGRLFLRVRQREASNG